MEERMMGGREVGDWITVSCRLLYHFNVISS